MVLLVLLVLIGAGAIMELPEIRRYLKIRSM
jgi:hypothetical protein